MLPVKKNFELSVWDPFRNLKRMHDDVDHLFASLWPERDGSFIEMTGWVPAVDLYEEKDRYVLKADVPGIKREDLSVNLSEDILTIKGERKHEKEEKGEDYFRHEAAYGAFERRVHVPGAVKADGVTADYSDGVLKVTLPKAEETKTREIKIKVK